MRILVISNYYPPFEYGGWPQLTHDIVQQLEARGHELLVLASRHGADRLAAPERNIRRVLHLASPNRDHYHPAYTLLYPLRNRQNRRYLVETLRDWQPEIVFQHGMWNMSRVWARDLETLCPERLVYYLANSWPTDLDAHTAYWQNQEGRFWKVKAPIGRLLSRTILAGEAQVRPRFDRILCVSAFIQRYLVEQVGVPVENTRVIHNGIDLQAFSPPEHRDWEPGRLRLLYAGSLVPHKGVHTAVEAMTRLPQLEQVTLTIIGSGHSDYEAGLRRTVAEHNLEGRVHFWPRVSRDEIPQMLSQFDALVFPSIWEEPLARMMQEAMASGLVVIGTPTGGTPELLVDGENGLAFEPENAGMLAEKIALLARDLPLRERMARAARAAVEARFSIDRMGDELEAYFEQMIAERKSKPLRRESSPGALEPVA